MPANIGNDFLSFNAATLLNQGNQNCLLNTSLPSIGGLTFSGVNSSYSGAIEFIRQQGWPTILINNTESIVNGNVLTLFGQGLGQILVGWNNLSDGGIGQHSSIYFRNKGSNQNSGWSNWYEILDSGNFTKYIATYTGEGAVGVWGIDITGNANTADYLRPKTQTGTYGHATYNLTPGSNDTLIWSEAFGDSTLKYTANGGQHSFTDTGNICFYLHPSNTQDDLQLNVYIDGTFEGHFKGNLDGNASKASNANISTVTNTLAYYDNTLGHFNYTPDIKYLKEALVSTESGVNGAKGRGNGLTIISDATYRAATDVIAQQQNILSYGDAGPQVRFQVTGTRGVILFNEHPETAGVWPSFHFLGQSVVTNNNVETKTNTGITLKSSGLVTTTYATFGQQTLSNTYTLTVAGESGFYSNINILNSIIHFNHNQQYIEWYDSAIQRETNNNQNYGTNLRWNGIGTYTVNDVMLLNISNYNGIHFTTNNDLTLLHNGKIIPAASTGAVGNATNPVYIDNGIFVATTYSINASILSGTANRIAYFSSTTVIDDAAHYINNSKIAVNSTTEPTENLLVNGKSRFMDNITIGSTGTKAILFTGTQIETTMINFIDNSENTYGNGITIGGGGLVVVGAGESAATTNILGITGVTPATEALYLFADTTVNIEANAEAFSNRLGIQITTSGNLIPVAAEAVNTNAQNLGSSTARWAKLYVGTADSYGSNTEPVYWNAGVPTALTYTANRLYYSASATSFEETAHYASSTKIAVNQTTQPTENFYVNGSSYFNGSLTLAGALIPVGQTINLGIGGENPSRINKLYIGDADTYGGVAQPIYWNNGVPAAISSTQGSGTQPIYLNAGTLTASTSTVGTKYKPTYLNDGTITTAVIVQKVNFEFSQNNKSVKITHDTDNTAFTMESIVLSIVVTEGESNLNSAITWKTANNYIALNVDTAVSGTVKGYVLISNGIEVADSAVSLVKSNSNI